MEVSKEIVSQHKKLLKELTSKKVGVNIGIASGPICAGVLGTSKFLYNVFGDTINTASRMMSTTSLNSIQVCNPMASLLRKEFNYSVQKRGQVQIKGKGNMDTYWLLKV